MKEEAEILFQQEITARKNDMKNLRSKTGSKGSSGSRKGVRTAYDYMSTKERKKLSGAVSVKNLFDLLLSKEEFESYPKEKRKEILIHWRDIYPNQRIMEALEVKSQGTFNKLLEDLEVPKKRSWKKNIKKEKPQARKEIQKEVTMSEEIAAPVADPIEKTDTIIFDGLRLNYNGVYNADQIEKILTKLQLIVNGEENKFIMSISLQEKK
jgi:hypothetical protein